MLLFQCHLWTTMSPAPVFRLLHISAPVCQGGWSKLFRWRSWWLGWWFPRLEDSSQHLRNCTSHNDDSWRRLFWVYEDMILVAVEDLPAPQSCCLVVSTGDDHQLVHVHHTPETHVDADTLRCSQVWPRWCGHSQCSGHHTHSIQSTWVWVNQSEASIMWFMLTNQKWVFTGALLVCSQQCCRSRCGRWSCPDCCYRSRWHWHCWSCWSGGQCWWSLQRRTLGPGLIQTSVIVTTAPPTPWSPWSQRSQWSVSRKYFNKWQ